jgi:TPR repeat protein
MLQWIREQWHQAQLRESAKKSPPNQSAEREALLFSGLWRELQDNQLDSVVSAAGLLLERGSPQELIEACKILAHAHLNNHRHAEAVSYFRFVAEQQNTPDAWFNLAAEEYFLHSFQENVFMLWQNEPSVIIAKIYKLGKK